MITDQQRENLRVLAKHLLTVKRPDFDMSVFLVDASNDDHLDPEDHACSSVGCAVGHGPSAGIAPIPEDKNWIRYASRNFGVETDPDYSSMAVGPLWNGLFDCSWATVDNTPQGASLRITRFLETGELRHAHLA